MIGNVVVLKYRSRTGRREIEFSQPFFSNEEYAQILKGVHSVFGRPDSIDVQRGIDLSLDGDRRTLAQKERGKDPKNGLSLLGSLPPSEPRP